MPWLIWPAHGAGVDTRYSAGFLRALSQRSAADGATNMLEGVGDAIKIPDRERGMCFSSQADKRGVNYISLGVFYTVN